MRSIVLWKKEKEGGKVSKRYGRLMKSEGEVVNGMMKRYRSEVTGWMDAMIARRKAEAGSSSDEDEEEKVIIKAARESDGDTIDDPALAESSGNPVAAATANLGPSSLTAAGGADAMARLSRGDVVMNDRAAVTRGYKGMINKSWL